MKYGLELKVVLNWRDIYMKDIKLVICVTIEIAGPCVISSIWNKLQRFRRSEKYTGNSVVGTKLIRDTQ